MSEKKAIERLLNAVKAYKLTPIVDDDFERIMGNLNQAIKYAENAIDNGQHDLSLSMLAERQKEFSEIAFGPGDRAEGILDHISKEIEEVRQSPGDLSEWSDIVLLCLDGMWRQGFPPDEISAAIFAKQGVNKSRAWPDWRLCDHKKAIEHERS